MTMPAPGTTTPVRESDDPLIHHVAQRDDLTRRGAMRRAGALLLVIVASVALLAPWLAPNPPDRRFANLLYAPPTPLHVFDAHGLLPHAHAWRLVSRIERTFEQDAETQGPVLVLGADAYGRDIFSRLLHGARTTLALAVCATLAATLLGALVGGVAGYASGWLDALLARLSEFVLVLPAIYVALALRAVMPLVLAASTVFALLLAIFALLGWPTVARGVRAIVASEREREYVVAARAAGASAPRLLLRHLLPAAAGYLRMQATLLLPAFILAEATLSYIGLGFPETTPTWGTMLQEAANVALLGDAPWTLAPAAAIFFVVLSVNLFVQGTGRPPIQLER
jgi:peptide/nickel transport system permease protein